MLAAHLSADIANGTEAVELAEKACRIHNLFLSGLWQPLTPKQADRYDDAVKAAEKAQNLAKLRGMEEVAERNQRMMELYRLRKPWREENVQ
jgi:hypothetical protein